MNIFDMKENEVKEVTTWYKTVDTKEQKKFQDWLKSHLKMGAVELTFQKKDGTMRVMNCTLEESKLPVYEKKTERTKTASTETLSVLDLDKNEWRSFRYDSIQQIAFKL
jgi:uncharacterized protein YccT (UPF0319 family)